MFERFRRWRFVRRTAARLVGEGLVAGLEEAAAMVARNGTVPWCQVAERVADDDRVARALEWLGHAPETDEVLALRCALERQQHPGSERPTLARLAQRQPGNEAVAVRLAEFLMDEGDFEGAVTRLAPFRSSTQPRAVHALGLALAGVGKVADAIAVLKPFLDGLDRVRDSYVVASNEVKQMSRLFDSLLAQQGGDEAVVLEHLRRGQLDARSATNHKLLSRSLMLASPRRAPSLTLESLVDLERTVERLRRADPSSSLVQAGQLALRREQVPLAADHFDAARELDRTHFGAALGQAVALDVQQRSLFKLAHAVPLEPEPPALQQVVPDWPALTPLERRLAIASSWPIRGLLPALAARGAVIRVLPLDVRPTDLPELQSMRGGRVEEDHRSWEGIAGLAEDRLAVARLDGLLDTSAHGLTFAHELAHLAERVLPSLLRARLDELYARARTTPFVFGQYALRNVHEFFAVHATFALLRHLGRELPTEFDEGGELETVLAFFDDVRRERTERPPADLPN